MDNKLVVVIMGQNCEKTIEMCLDSVKEADAIVYCDGGSRDESIDIFYRERYTDEKARKYIFIENKFIQDKPNMITIQKNFWLDYIKKNYKGWWCLYLDADEVVDNLNGFKLYMLEGLKETILSSKMRHLIGNLCTEDATQQVHYVPNRFFYVDDDLYFPMNEHGFVKSDKRKDNYLPEEDCMIWHLGYLGGVWDVKGRYDGQLNRQAEGSHSKDFLEKWKNTHLLGLYPTQKVNPTDLPKVILDGFNIDKDMLYFANRGMELKHPLMVKQWNDYFKPTSVLDLGCGRGCYLYFWNWFVPNHCMGIELSNWAVNNSFVTGILEGNVIDEKPYIRDLENWDLITAIDVLEHLTDEQLDKTLKNMVKYGKKFLFSIPFIGNPDLDNDKTHIQRMTKEEWIKLIASYGIIIEETPKDWLFVNQILIGEKCLI